MHSASTLRSRHSERSEESKRSGQLQRRDPSLSLRMTDKTLVFQHHPDRSPGSERHFSSQGPHH